MDRISIITVILLMLLFGALSKGVTAQVGINTEQPSPNAALHIKSPNGDMGLLIPQMTTSDVESINVSTDSSDPNLPTSANENGLVVYNTQTGCYNYWQKDAGEWYSLCGTPPPAIFTVVCNDVKAVGSYIEGQTFGINNYLQAAVTVTSPGTYSVTASTTANNGNGYYFSSSGTFPKAGNYVINLAGAGTPLQAAETPNGNSIDFIYNNQTQSNCFMLAIQSAQPDYCIRGVKQMPSTPWAVAPSGLDAGYYAEVTLQVNKPGAWEINSGNAINGVQFAGSGLLHQASGYNHNGTFPQTVTVNVPVVLPAMAASNSPASTNYTFSAPNSACRAQYPLSVHWAQVGFDIDGGCAAGIDVSQLGTLTQGSTVDATKPIIISLTNITGGVTQITAQFAGLSYSTSPTGTAGNGGEIDITGLTSIELYPTGTSQSPNQAGTFDVNIASSAGGFNGCGATPKQVTVNAGQANFRNISITGATNNSHYLVDKRQGYTDVPCDLILSAQADEAGLYNLTVTTNSVTWAGSGQVQTGNNIIILKPYNANINRPANNNPHDISVEYPTSGGSTAHTNRYTVYFIHRQINILSIGGRDMDRPNSGTATVMSTDAILKKASNFGYNGRVGVKAINIINGGNQPSPANLRNMIKNNHIDIVFAAWDYPLGTGSNLVQNSAILKEFAEKGGVVVYASQSGTHTSTFLNGFYGVSNIQAPYYTGQGRFAITSNSTVLNGAILNGGKWGSSYTGSGIKTDFAGKYIGDDCSNGTRIISGLPSTAMPIATWQGTGNCPAGAVFMFVDNTKNLFYCGDFAWANGRGSGSQVANNGAFPSVNNNGEPAYKTNYVNGNNGEAGAGSSAQLVNSFIYANVMAWAIEKAAN